MEKARSSVPGSQAKAVLEPVLGYPMAFAAWLSLPLLLLPVGKEEPVGVGSLQGCEWGHLAAVMPPLLIIGETLDRGSQSGVILPPRRWLAMPGDIFGCHKCRAASGI